MILKRCASSALVRTDYDPTWQVVAGCTYAFHMASPFIVEVPDDEADETLATGVWVPMGTEATHQRPR